MAGLKEFGLATLAVTLAWAGACSQPTANTQSNATIAPPTATNVKASVPNSASTIADCATIERQDPPIGPSSTKTCSIALTGIDAGSSFKIELISGKVEQEGQLGADSLVRVTKMVGDEGGQAIEEAGVSLLVPAQYRDINGDGEGDLLITRDVGNVNATVAVWMGDPSGEPFVRAGEVAGQIEAVTKDKLIPVSNRGSANTMGYSFYQFAEQQLMLVASVIVTATATSPEGNVTATICKLDDTSGLAEAGINAAAAKAKFCGEPVVLSAYK